MGAVFWQVGTVNVGREWRGFSRQPLFFIGIFPCGMFFMIFSLSLTGVTIVVQSVCPGGIRRYGLPMAAFLDIAKSFPGLVRDGFRSMPLGRTLWFVVLLKLFIMFAVLRAFFFPNFLNSNFDTEREKSVYVGNELVERGR